MPTGTTLSSSAALTISKAGQIVSGLDVKGCVTVNAANVVIEKSRITGGCTNVIQNNSTGLIVRDSEIVGTGANTEAIGWTDYTLLRVNIHGTGDGARANGNVVIQDSWIHGLVSSSDSHNDGVQVTEGSNIRIVHNAIENPNGQTSAVMIGADQGAISDIAVQNNLLNGGGYTLYAGGGPGITVTGNHFGKKFFPKCGYYGPVNISDSGVAFTGNVWDDTGAPVS